MTPLQRFVQYVIIANAIVNLLTFVNLKPDLSNTFNQFVLSVSQSEVTLKNSD